MDIEVLSGSYFLWHGSVTKDGNPIIFQDFNQIGRWIQFKTEIPGKGKITRERHFGIMAYILDEETGYHDLKPAPPGKYVLHVHPSLYSSGANKKVGLKPLQIEFTIE